MTPPTWPVAPTTPTRRDADMDRTITAASAVLAASFGPAEWILDRSGTITLMRRRAQLVPWTAAGQTSERQASGDDVVRTTGWVFNNETGSQLTLEQFVATGDSEVPAYLTVFGLREPDADGRTPADKKIVEIGCGIGRMTCAFTREYGAVVACDLDAGFLERCFETVGRFGNVDRLRTSHVTTGTRSTSHPTRRTSRSATSRSSTAIPTTPRSSPPRPSASPGPAGRSCSTTGRAARRTSCCCRSVR